MKYHCVINAFARAIGITPEELVRELPHDGLGNIPGTNIQRSHHIQEVIDAASKRNVWFCPIELVPQAFYYKTNEVYPVLFGGTEGNFQRFRKYLEGSTGVLVGILNSEGHAVYWDGSKCIDHRGGWDLWEDEFVVSTYWRSVWTT